MGLHGPDERLGESPTQAVKDEVAGLGTLWEYFLLGRRPHSWECQGEAGRIATARPHVTTQAAVGSRGKNTKTRHDEALWGSGNPAPET